MKEYRKFIAEDNQIADGGTQWLTEEDIVKYPGNIALVEAGEEPVIWAQMTVQNAQLVPASAEVLAARRQAETIRQAEFVRSAREARYRTETDTLLFDALEAYAKKHPEETLFSEWLASKERIRQTVPKPNASSHE